MAVFKLSSFVLLLVLVQHSKVWGHNIVNLRCEVPTHGGLTSHNTGTGTADTCTCTKTKEKVADLEKKLHVTAMAHLEMQNKIRLQQEQLVKSDALMSNLTDTLGSALEKIKKMEEILSVPKECPSGFVELGGSCYYISTAKKTWLQAQEYCQSLSANLATITSKAENEMIAANLPDSVPYWWIGANDRENEGRWVWVATNATLTFTNWFRPDDEPNNLNGNEDCVVIYYKEYNNKWNDASCITNTEFVCERSRI
ncbi:perlucin-like [Lingula anatina]|uniref:Perlucin-like n=1 Tax=Lingula anatina TaxID=7574 RepID=A0A1S3HGT7_LINAN|nr:perlucin-like [Lingula anatina]|eukprot:XP_013385293.1 perlucin-like [Lingula anatina]